MRWYSVLVKARVAVEAEDRKAARQAARDVISGSTSDAAGVVEILGVEEVPSPSHPEAE